MTHPPTDPDPTDDTDHTNDPMMLRQRQFARFARVYLAAAVVLALAAGGVAVWYAYHRIAVLENDLAQRRAARVHQDDRVRDILEEYRRTICTLSAHTTNPGATDVQELRRDHRCDPG